MREGFLRSGPLQDINSYPAWAQDLVQDCADTKRKVVDHDLFKLMRDAELGQAETHAFLAGTWPVIEQFPQYMAMNLVKIEYGRSHGQDMARRYLIRNIRIEQSHADHWIEWSEASGFSKEELLAANVPMATHVLSHWCWHTCQRDPLVAAMAATNYAIEGATGEWSMVVCSKDDYENSFDPQVRRKATKWLRLHAEYDDKHPWEALEIICTIMGPDPTTSGIALLRSCILKSYDYMRLSLDCCLDDKDTRARSVVHLHLPVEQRERQCA